MQDVTNQRHLEAFEAPLVVADGVHIEQALCRVAMAAIARVNDMDVAAAGTAQMVDDQVRRPTRFVTHDKHIGVHSAEVINRVEQRLTFGGRRCRHVQIDHIGRQTLGRNFERRTGARRVFEENVEHTLAAQQRDFFHIAV